MATRLPKEFPKIWPYSDGFETYADRALALHGEPFTNWHLLQFLSKPLMLFGLLVVVVPFSLFAYSLLIGGAMWLLSTPFAARTNRLQADAFAALMADLRDQVAVESESLTVAASEPKLDGPDAENNAKILAHFTHKHYTPNWKWVREALLDRDSHRCCACGRHVQLADSVAHHIRPFSEDGKTGFANLVTLCIHCHSRVHPWLNPKLNFFWIRQDRGQVYCWKCKRRLDTVKEDVVICSDCGWLHHVVDGACGCNYPGDC